MDQYEWIEGPCKRLDRTDNEVDWTNHADLLDPGDLNGWREDVASLRLELGVTTSNDGTRRQRREWRTGAGNARKASVGSCDLNGNVCTTNCIVFV